MSHMLKQTVLAYALLSSSFAHAGFLDFIKDIDTSKLTSSTAASLPANLSNAEVVSGLKQALKKGTSFAVDNLSSEGGFLNQPDVKIPIPASLKPIASSLEMIGQNSLVENFQTTLNKAAEQAVPEAAAIFADTIQNMSIEEAANILKGPENAATEYFKKRSSEQLLEKFLPIVKQATNNAGVTASYKQLIAHTGSFGNFISSQSPDIDNFVAQKAVDALFLRIAEQEKLIRENPAARTTDLLKKVFTL